MRRADFAYTLPRALIAVRPLPERSASRLLVLDGATGSIEDRVFRELPGFLGPGDVLVLNDTRVLPARLSARKETGGACEVLLERVLDERRILAQARTSKPLRRGSKLLLGEGASARVLGGQDGFHELELDRPALPFFERHGRVPLPPYLGRADDEADRERYQTVYAQEPGAVAAPTAGLHFDAGMLDRIAGRGTVIARLTLHVGAGTFQPLRTDALESHRLHAERYRVPEPAVAAIETARAGGGRVVAVGTTVVRALEAAAAGGRLAAGAGETDLFIRPGYRFRVVDALLTNFHLPGSTLLMLVCAFAGTGRVMAAYRHAVQARYRFFSYGDAMLVGSDPAALAPRGTDS